MKKRKRNKGFKRSGKEWEESIAGHIGKILDNTSARDIADLGIMAGISYVGYEVMGFGGILYGLISYKLAQSMNVAAGTAGVIGLVSLGLAESPIAEAVAGFLKKGQEAVRIWTGEATCREKMSVYYRRLYREEPPEEWLQKQCPLETP